MGKVPELRREAASETPSKAQRLEANSTEVPTETTWPSPEVFYSFDFHQDVLFIPLAKK